MIKQIIIVAAYVVLVVSLSRFAKLSFAGDELKNHPEKATRSSTVSSR